MGLFKTGGSFTLGMAVGAGLAFFAPQLVKAVARASLPLAKEMIKAGLIVMDKGQEYMKEAKQALDEEAPTKGPKTAD